MFVWFVFLSVHPHPHRSLAFSRVGFVYFSTSFSPFSEWIFFGGIVAVVRNIDVCLVNVNVFVSSFFFGIEVCCCYFFSALVSSIEHKQMVSFAS